jgi:hypothetical protein
MVGSLPSLMAQTPQAGPRAIRALSTVVSIRRFTSDLATIVESLR